MGGAGGFHDLNSTLGDTGRFDNQKFNVKHLHGDNEVTYHPPSTHVSGSYAIISSYMCVVDEVDRHVEVQADKVYNRKVPSIVNFFPKVKLLSNFGDVETDPRPHSELKKKIGWV